MSEIVVPSMAAVNAIEGFIVGTPWEVVRHTQQLMQNSLTSQASYCGRSSNIKKVTDEQLIHKSFITSHIAHAYVIICGTFMQLPSS